MRLNVYGLRFVFECNFGCWLKNSNFPKVNSLFRSISKWLFLWLLIWGRAGFAVAQVHGVPGGVRNAFEAGAVCHDTLPFATFSAGYFYANATSAFGGQGRYDTRLPFSVYQRQGAFVDIQRPLFGKFAVGFMLPWYESVIYRPDAGGIETRYKLRGVSEIRLRLKYLNNRPGFSWYAGLGTGLPIGEGRVAFTSPHAFIGNDGFWNLEAQAGCVRRTRHGWNLYANASWLMRIPRSGAVFEGDTALFYTSGRYPSIQATLSPGDCFTVDAGGIFPLGRYQVSTGYVFFYELPHKADYLKPLSHPELEIAVNRVMGGESSAHSVLAGVSRDFGSLRFGLMLKVAVAGKSTFNEKILIFMTRYTIINP